MEKDLVLYFDTFATIRYSPKSLGERASAHWYLVLDADPAIGKYYRKLYELSKYRCERLEAAAWQAHVTVIRDEEPPDAYKRFWERYSGLPVWLRCFPEQAGTNGFYHWLDIYCPTAYTIRRQLGLPATPEIPLHITIGHRPECERKRTCLINDVKNS